MYPDESLKMEGLTPGKKLAYDPQSRTYVAGGGGLQLWNADGGTRKIFQEEASLLKGVAIDKQEERKLPQKEFCPPDCLRFVPNQKSHDLVISPSGLMVLSKHSIKQSETRIVYTNYGFSSGTHYWEIYCPLSLTGLRLGVVKKENMKLTLEEMNTFRTTTGRVVGLLLDLPNKKLKFWLNGKEQISRARTIGEGYWLPAIRISGIDNCVILNPFAQYKGYAAPYCCLSEPSNKEALKAEFERYFNSWLLLTEMKKDIPSLPPKDYVKSQIPTEVNIIDAIVLSDEEKKPLGCAFVFVSDEEQFCKDCDNSPVKPKIHKATELANAIISTEKSILSSIIVKACCIREDIMKRRTLDLLNDINSDKPEGREKFQEINNNLEMQEKSESVPEDKICRCEYLPFSDKLLLIGKQTLKLVSRKEGESNSLQEALTSPAYSLATAPLSSSEKISLYLSINEAKMLTHKLNWGEILEETQAVAAESLLHFVVALEIALSKAESVDKESSLKLVLPYFNAKKATDSLLKSILRALSESELDETIKENCMKYFYHNIGQLTPEKIERKELQKHLNLEDLHFLLHILFKLDEQLWCLANSDSGGEDVRALWDSQVSRIHTAYGRLSSFVTYHPSSAIELAEAGLYNCGDKRVSLGHFLEPGSLVENPLVYDLQTRKEIWSMLERNFPNNRMLRGEYCSNIPLDLTLKYIPALSHFNLKLEPQEIDHVEYKPNSPFLLICSKDGTACVYNTRLRLFKVLSINFKSFFQSKKLPSLPKIKQESEFELTYNLFEEEVNTRAPEAIELPPEEPVKEEKKKEEVKKVVEPKAEFVEQLVLMGFEEEVAKKALIAINNESIEAAMDSALKFQTEQPPPKPPAPPVEGIILSWACPKCTLINVEGKKNCEACGASAPQSAFISAQKKKEEVKEKKEIKKQTDEQQQKEKEEKKQKEMEQKELEELQIKMIEASKVCGYAFNVSEAYPSYPFTVSCALSTENEMLLIARRFKYSNKYLHSFVSNILAGNKGGMDQLSDFWLKKNDERSIQEYILKEKKDTLETFYPLFVKNQLKDGWMLPKTKIADLPIVTSSDVQFNLPYENVLSMCSVTLQKESEEQYIFLVVVEKGDLFLVKIQQIILDNGNFALKNVSRIPLDPSKTVKLMTDDNGSLVLATESQIRIFDAESLESKRKIFGTWNIDNIQLILESSRFPNYREISEISESSSMNVKMPEKYHKSVIVIKEEGEIKKYVLSGAEIHHKKVEEHESSSMVGASMDYPEIKPEDIGIEELITYERQMRSIRIGTLADKAEGAILASTKKSINSSNYSKHNWTIINASQPRYEFVISSKEPLTLNHLNVSLTFTQSNSSHSSEQGNISEIGIKEETKEVVASGLGLLSMKSSGEIKTDSTNTHIPLMIYSFHGAQYNFQNSVTRMLFDGNIIYASNYPKPQFIFCHQFNKRMLLEQFVVRSEIGTVCGGQPIGAGLIFISDQLSAFDNVNEYLFINTAEEYKNWLEKRKLSPKPLQSSEPAGFFEMGTNLSIIGDIDNKRPGYYFMLKPTAFRTAPVKSNADFNIHPLEIMYFGVIGEILDEDIMDLPQANYTQKILDKNFITPFKMTLFMSNNGKDWKTASSEIQPLTVGELKGEKANLNVQEIIQNIIKPSLPLYRYGGLYRSAISDTRIQTMSASYFKLVIERIEDTSVSAWDFSSVNLEAFVACDSEVTSKTLKGLPTSYLRTCMSDPKFFKKFNLAIVTLTSKSEINHHLRMTACQLLNKIIKQFPEQAVQIAQAMQVQEFIHHNIYRQDQSNVATALSLLQQLSTLPDFCKQVNQIVLQDIAIIPSFKLSSSGFEAFFELLRWTLPIAEEEATKRILNTLFKLSTKYIEPLQRPEVTFLRTRFECQSYPFDPWTFFLPVDEEEQKNGDPNKKVSAVQKQRVPLQSKILLNYTQTLDEFVIDLQQRCLAKELRLIFGKLESTQFKFKVSVYGVLDCNLSSAPKRTLLYQNTFEDYTWVQLTDFAHKQGPAFDSNEELEALEISHLNFIGRYFIVQFQYIKCFKTFTEEDSVVPDLNIIPEMYGKVLGPCGIIEEFETAFKQANDDIGKKQENIKVGHSLLTEKFEFTKKDCILYRNFIETEPVKPSESIAETGKPEHESEQELAYENLKKLQVELAVNALEHATKQKDNTASIKSLLSSINKEHKTIFLSRFTGPITEPSLQYLISICIEYSNILCSCMKDKPNKMLQNLDKPLMEFAKSFFKVFVVREKGQIRSEILKLLKEIIIPKLDDSQWIWFMFNSISEFLSSPNPYISQKSVISALDILSIPDGEILSFLVEKLQDEDLNNALKNLVKPGKLEKITDDSKFSFLSSVLLLALQSLKKINLQEGEDIHKGIMCNVCNNQKWIAGNRYKCGHCANFNVCGNRKCMEAHLAEYPEHVFILIPLPLPYPPSTKELQNLQPKPLLPPFSFIATNSKKHDGITCEACQVKDFEGVRYQCANCDDFNLCQSCFETAKEKHSPNHVFIIHNRPVTLSTTGTPKALIQLLNPLLYPIPTSKVEQEPLSYLNTKRSYSFTPSASLLKNKTTIKRLDYDQNMIIVYNICKWICNHDSFPHDQKCILLKLSIELFVFYTHLVSMESLRKLLEDSESFVNLVMNVLHFNDATITVYITEIVESLKSPQTAKPVSADKVQNMKPRNRIEYLEKQEVALEIKILLCNHIQTMLKTLVDFAGNDSNTSSHPLYNIYANQQVWNEHLSYLLELFLGVAERANAQKKELKVGQKQEQEIALPPLPMMRSVSLSSGSSHPIQKMETESMHSTTLSIHITKSLVNLLNPHSNRIKVVRHIANLWTLVLKALTMIPLTTVVETKIFDTLVHSFLQSQEEVQQTTYAEILQMTQQIVKEPALIEETSKFLLNLLLATLDLGMGTDNEVLAYNVCSGWLDILITKETPKPEEFSGEVFVRLCEDDTVLLLRKGVEMLTKYLSIGPSEGVANAQINIVMRIEILADIFRLLATATSTCGKNISCLCAVFKNWDNYKKGLEGIISDLIVWLFLNEKVVSHTTNASEMLLKISGYIHDILQYFIECEDLLKLGLSTMIEFVKQFDMKIYNMAETSTISFSVATKQNDRVNKLILRLIESWIISDKMALTFALDLKGFEFLLDRIRAADSRSQKLAKIQEDSESKSATPVLVQPHLNIASDLEEAICDQLASSIKVASKEEEFSIKYSKKFESRAHNLQEFGKTMLLQHTSSGEPLTSFQKTDWAVNKKGYRQKLYNRQLTGTMKNEFVMTFKLHTVAEISEIQLGIVNYWGGTNELYMEPTSIVVEAGMSLSNMNMICTLKHVRDDGYANYSTSVFGRNMESFTSENGKTISQQIELKLDSLPHFCAHYLRFKFRKGVIACTESSPQVALLKKNRFFAINYISVMGYDVSNLGNYCAYIIDIQKETALQTLLHFCSGDFTKTLKVLATQEETLEKIKSSFEMLAELINTKEKLIEPTLISISSLNREMGEWILDKFLQPNRTKKQIVLLADLILSDIEEIPRRIHKFKDFIFSELVKFQDITDTLGDKIKYLLNFIKVYICAVRLSSRSIEKQIVLNQTQEEILVIFKILENCKELPIQKKLFRFLLLELYPPPLFENNSVNPYEFFTKFLLKDCKDGMKLLLASYFVCTDRECAKGLLESNLFKEELIKGISAPGISQSIFWQFWLNCCSQPSVKNHLAQMNIEFVLYDSLKDTSDEKSNKILKNIPEDVLNLIVEIIKIIVSGQEELEKEMAKKIIKDLVLLSTRQDLDYVNKVLLPIMRMEQIVPICVNPYDSDLKKAILVDSRKSGLQQKIPTSTLFFATTLLNVKQKNVLLKTFKQQLHNAGSFKKISKAKWSKIYSDTTTEVAKWSKFWEAIQHHGPIIFIVNGTFKGKPVVFGAYTSQPMPSVPSPMEADYNINVNSNEENFYFFYEEDNCHHFKPVPGEIFASFVVDYDLGGAVGFANDFFWLSFSFDYVMTFGDQNAVQCLEDHNFHLKEGNLTLTNLEVWSSNLSKGLNRIPEESKKIPSLPKCAPTKHPWKSLLYPYNLFRINPVYCVPVGVKPDQLSMAIIERQSKLVTLFNNKELVNDQELGVLHNVILEKAPRSNSIIDVEYDIHEVLETEFNREFANQKEEIEADNIGYLPKMGVFERFEEYGGVKELISVTLSSIKMWKNSEAATKWTLWLQELDSFSSIPLFFKLFIKNKKCKDLLFTILAGLPDFQVPPENKKLQEEETKKWEEEYQAAVRSSYQNLAEVFRISSDSTMRETAFDNGLINRILDRIGALTGEKGRKWEEKEDEEDKEENKKEEKKDENKEEKKKVEKNTEKKKRKGVGYSASVGEVWKVHDYLENKKLKNEQIKIMVDILSSFIQAKDWKPSRDLFELFAESPLLMLIENALRTGSLLEMVKESIIFYAFFDLIRAFLNQKKLVPLLLELNPHYKPSQIEPIYLLLKKLNGLANIFLTCLPKDATEESKAPAKLATEIQKLYETVMKGIEEEQKRRVKKHFYKDALTLPLTECYRMLLKDLRFDYMDMKDSNKKNYVHHYASTASGKTNPPASKMVRLAQELADLSNSLPCEHNNSIFVRVDKDRVDMMKAIIMGASETPYAHGAFEYDIFLDNDYPNGPPKMNLTTTGSAAIRFNPNLYNCGKVCISLLGTWRGQATENWDPRVSTILQLLMSTQAIIMSEEVYFNEPGFEGEQGSPEGERKNEAYSNVVRIGNIKFAMLGQIRNPPKGFETVIRRHFYIKKDEILKEVKSWIDLADKNEASYTGLVYDHNSSWCKQFKENKGKYKEMLVEAIKELEEELDKLAPPSGEDIEKMKEESKQESLKEIDITEGMAKLGEIDVSDDTEVKVQKELKLEDESVTDRWSRYVAALGVEAVAKQAAASIFMTGVNAVGVETAKNLILAGCKRFTVHDHKNVELSDISGQFFLQTEDKGKNKAQISASRLQQLNYYVKVDYKTERLPLKSELLEELLLKEKYSVIIAADTDANTALALSEFAHKHEIKFILGQVNGVCSRVFLDLGDKFETFDKDGEEPVQVMIQSISSENPGKVKTLGSQRHNLSTGDYIFLTEVEGMKLIGKETESINNTKHTVTVIDPYIFTIGDTTQYTPYVRNGIAKQLKTSKIIHYESLKSIQDKHLLSLDSQMSMIDFEKANDFPIIQVCFEALSKFENELQRLPTEWNLGDAEKFVKYFKELLTIYNIEITESMEMLALKFSFTARGMLCPLAAFIGGFVAQEAVKAITQKHSPLSQLFCYHVMELVPKIEKGMLASFEKQKQILGLDSIKPDRYYGMHICLGMENLNKIMESETFMVGCGAIGCELLKNYAMIGLGTADPSKNPRHQVRGRIIITDPDVIEVSNLNRQFLFREKHLRSAKSSTAAAAAIHINPDLKDHVVARLDKVHEGTVHIFNDHFFTRLTAVTNALDNIQARRYIDQRCVTNKVPLIESGTLGPKGHVQVVIPYKTESYSSQNDPEDNNAIPICTLKMFPEETVHCVEWARDKFGKIFTQAPKTFNQVIEEKDINPVSSQEITAIKQAIRLLKKRPENSGDCIAYARRKFQKYFVNDIRQLLFTYPKDMLVKGHPFWSLPKRPPDELTFNPKDPLHATFIASLASIKARTSGIPDPPNIRLESVRFQIAEEAAKISVAKFIPSSDKAKEISAQVEKVEATEEEKKEEKKEEEEKFDAGDVKSLVEEWNKLVKQKTTPSNPVLRSMVAEEFEKDVDSNGHVDFLFAMANLRARCYKLEEMSWINVKVKAGRIVPALATTTACVAGLQTIELIKLLKKESVETHRNAFLNLALPLCSLSEPGLAQKIKLTPNLEVTLWDRWDVKLEKGRHVTLKEVMRHLEMTYGLFPKDVLRGAKPIYLYAIMNLEDKKAEREKMLGMKLFELLQLSEEEYVDLNVTFSAESEGKILASTPPVRVYFI